MTEKTINCAECGNSFTYTPNPKYIDKRKYCDDCGKKKNEEWIAAQAGTMDKIESDAELLRQEALKYAKEKDDEVHKTLTAKPNGYKLTEENIRIGALTCAVKKTQIDTPAVVFWELVKEFEEYIRNGK